MSWFAVDDRFWSHPKVMSLRRSAHFADAVAVWTLAGCWVAGDEKCRDDGIVPLDVVAGLGLPNDQWEAGVKELVRVRLFDEHPEQDAVGFHNWEYWNGPDAKARRIDRRLEADRLRQR